MRSTSARLLRPVFILFLLLAAALPLKFGALTGIPETTSMFPANIWEAAIINWPSMSFPMFSGVLLLLVMLIPGRKMADGSAAVYGLLWLALLGVTFIGIINASTMDFVYLQIVHIAGLTALAVAGAMLLRQNAEYRPLLLATIAVVSVIIALLGVQQYFFGFQETIDMMRQQAQYGPVKSEVLEAFLKDRRIFSTFTLPNSMAGYMLLTMPLCLLGCWNVCGRVEPPKVTRSIFMPTLFLLLGFVFVMTRSRAAFISFGAACGVFLVMLPLARRFRAALIGSIILAVAAGFIYIHFSSRGFSSIVARIDYNLISFKIMAAYPFAGTGWGDFFHDYMLLKTLPTDEAPHTPHSFIMTYACQTGIAGLLVAAAVMIFPLWRGLRNIKSIRLAELITIDNAILFGLTAWSFHSLLDVNLESPGCTGTAILLALALLSRRGDDVDATLPVWCLRRDFRFAMWLTSAVVVVLAVAGSWVLSRGEYQYAELTRLQSEYFKPQDNEPPINPEQISMQFAATVNALPWSPFPWASMGRFLAAGGDVAGAEKCYFEALKRSPERAAFYYELSRIQAQSGQSAAAAENFDKARKLFPKNPKYLEP